MSLCGGSDSAAKAAQAQQDAQTAQVQGATAQINQIFDNPARTAQYSRLANDTTNYYMGDLNQQKKQNDLQMKFALARNGQTGSSVQTDQATTAADDYQKGVLQATQEGQQASSKLQAQDEQSRANLIAEAQGGLDTGAAATNAAGALKANLSGAQANNTSDALGNVFGSFANLYQQSQTAAALRNGQLYGYSSLYGPVSNTAGVA